ncbi:hypothetical protein ACSBR2_040493 [Camellia fascicularis]
MAVDPSRGHDLVTLELEEDTDECEDNSSLCLIRKILTSKALNKQAVSQILRGAWKTRAEVSITSWPDNVYLFNFGDEEDRALILRTAPWSVMENLLVLQPLQIGKAISEVDFTYSPFWVQVHGLPMEKMMRRNGHIIAETIGKLVGVEAPTDGLLLARSFLRVRVEVNTSLPLPRGFLLKRQKPDSTGKTDLWVVFKYECLSDFCYDCGRIGHDNKSCKFVTREVGKLSGYGPELRTGVASNLGLAVKHYHDQIDDLDYHLRPILSRQRSSTPTSGSGVHGPSETGQASTAERVEPRSPLPPPSQPAAAVLSMVTPVLPFSLPEGGTNEDRTKVMPSGPSTLLNEELSTPAVQPLKPILTMVTQGPNITSKPILSSHIMVRSQSPSQPAYYVTELSDSPTSQISPQGLFPSCTPSTIQNDTPSLLSKPISISLCPDATEGLLSSAFTGLSLKRKASDENYLLPTPPKTLKLDSKILSAPLSLAPSLWLKKAASPRNRGEEGGHQRSRLH